jgi:hypothetical protein
LRAKSIELADNQSGVRIYGRTQEPYSALIDTSGVYDEMSCACRPPAKFVIARKSTAALCGRS